MASEFLRRLAARETEKNDAPPYARASTFLQARAQKESENRGQPIRSTRYIPYAAPQASEASPASSVLSRAEIKRSAKAATADPLGLGRPVGTAGHIGTTSVAVTDVGTAGANNTGVLRDRLEKEQIKLSSDMSRMQGGLSRAVGTSINEPRYRDQYTEMSSQLAKTNDTLKRLDEMQEWDAAHGKKISEAGTAPVAISTDTEALIALKNAQRKQLWDQISRIMYDPGKAEQTKELSRQDTQLAEEIGKLRSLQKLRAKSGVHTYPASLDVAVPMASKEQFAKAGIRDVDIRNQAREEARFQERLNELDKELLRTGAYWDLLSGYQPKEGDPLYEVMQGKQQQVWADLGARAEKDPALKESMEQGKRALNKRYSEEVQAAYDKRLFEARTEAALYNEAINEQVDMLRGKNAKLERGMYVIAQNMSQASQEGDWDRHASLLSDLDTIQSRFADNKQQIKGLMASRVGVDEQTGELITLPDTDDIDRGKYLLDWGAKSLSTIAGWIEDFGHVPAQNGHDQAMKRAAETGASQSELELMEMLFNQSNPTPANDYLEELDKKLALQSQALGPGWEFAGQKVEALVGSLPALGMDLATGGLYGSIAMGVMPIATYYKTAKKNGATDEQAVAYALLNTSINVGKSYLSQAARAAIGPALDGIVTKNLTKAGLGPGVQKAVMWSLDRMGGGAEGVFESLLEPYIVRATYDPHAPLADKEMLVKAFLINMGADIILNAPKDLAKLSMKTLGFDESTLKKTGKEIIKAGAWDGVIDAGLAMPEGSNMYKLAQKLDAQRNAGQLISDIDIGRLLAGNFVSATARTQLDLPWYLQNGEPLMLPGADHALKNTPNLQDHKGNDAMRESGAFDGQQSHLNNASLTEAAGRVDVSAYDSQSVFYFGIGSGDQAEKAAMDDRK